MKEQNIQTIFGNWVATNTQERSFVWELKLCKTNALPFNAVRRHQIAKLLKAKKYGHYEKISDVPFGHSTGFRFHKQRAFDGIFVKQPDAYVIVVYYVPREYKMTFFIDIEVWLNEEKISQRKSLTIGRAREICTKIIQL